ncbi:MAG: hypothetical protein AAFZ65_17410, partial [Planctomycetota bacterium]
MRSADAPHAPRAARLALLAVLATTALAQAWTLTLSFQLDDYTLVWRPLELFQLATDLDDSAVESYALRWTVWSLWAALDAVMPVPRSELPYHLLGLAMHLGVTALVFQVTRDLMRSIGRGGSASTEPAPSTGLVWAPTLAGLWFGVQAGHAQAFSWIAAWSDLMLTGAGLLAVGALLRARLTDGEHRDAPRWPVALWTLLALLTKTPSLALPPILLWLALLLPPPPLARDPRGLARRGHDAIAIGIAFGTGLAIRAAYLGSARPRYGGQTDLGPADLPRVLFAGVENVGQAVAATVVDPLVADETLAVAGTSGSELGAAVVAATFLLWMVARPDHWRLGLALIGAVVAAAGPAGAIFGDIPNNVTARTAYQPLAFVAVAVGLALRGGWGRGGTLRAATGLLGLLLVATWAAGRADVVATERLADAERRQHRSTLQAAAERVGSTGIVVLLDPPDGFAGVAQLGSLLRYALLPDYWAGPRPEVVACGGLRQLRATLEADRFRGRKAAVLMPVDATGVAPAELRAGRWLHDAVADHDPWPTGDPAQGWTVEHGPLQTTISLPTPRPAFGFAGLSFAPAGAGSARIRYLA